MKKQPLLWPDEIFSSYAEVSAEFLRARGVRALLCDIDNTLVTYDDAEPTEAVCAWLDSLRASGVTVGFLSNNENARVERFNQSLGLYAKAKAGKPSRRAALQFLQNTGFSPQQTALLGDQIYAPKLKTPVRIPRLMLHAYSLAFTHPTTGKRMRFCAPLPAAFEETLQKLR